MTEASQLQQYEIVWVMPWQYALTGCPEGLGTPHGFGLEIVDFLGPGDLDGRGERTVWVRGPVTEATDTPGGVRLVHRNLMTVAIPHDQPRAYRTGGRILPPPSALSSPNGAACAQRPYRPVGQDEAVTSQGETERPKGWVVSHIWRLIRYALRRRVETW